MSHQDIVKRLLDSNAVGVGTRPQSSRMPMNRMRAHFVLTGLVMLALAVSCPASTIGNPAVSGPQVDGCNGCSFALLNPFPAGDFGFHVTSYSLFAFDFAVHSGQQITPLLFDESGGAFTVSGVGTTRTISSTGVLTFGFDLTDGSSLVGTQTFFGYRDGTVASGNTGPELA